LEPDARLTAMWLWTLGGGKTAASGNGPHPDSLPEGEGEEDADDEESAVASAKSVGYTLEYDAARKIAQGLGIHLEKSESIVAVKGETARLLPVSERTQYLFGKGATAGATRSAKGRAKAKQKTLFDELGDAEATEAGWTELKGPPPGSTVLDRLHQAMILFAAGRGELMKRFLLDDGVGRDSRFWKLAQSLSALYPPGTDEKRWVNAGWTACWRARRGWGCNLLCGLRTDREGSVRDGQTQQEDTDDRAARAGVWWLADGHFRPAGPGPADVGPDGQ
jgi:hypothetical protein